MTRAKRPAVAILGTGRLARAFHRLLRNAGYPVRLVASRPPQRHESQRRNSARARAARDLQSAIDGATIVLLAVPDSAVRATAARLARVAGGWPSRVALHHAGALGCQELSDLAELGASVGVLHPLQSLAAVAVAAQILPGSAARIEGDPRAVRVARRLARDLRLVPLRIAKPLTPAGRAAYHAAAALVANDLIALIRIGSALLRGIGVEQAAAERALARLARGVTLNVEALGLEDALTGPIARGDAATLAAQLQVLARESPNAARAHRALSSELVRLAHRHGNLSATQRRKLIRLLSTE